MGLSHEASKQVRGQSTIATDIDCPESTTSLAKKSNVHGGTHTSTKMERPKPIEIIVVALVDRRETSSPGRKRAIVITGRQANIHVNSAPNS